MEYWSIAVLQYFFWRCNIAELQYCNTFSIEYCKKYCNTFEKYWLKVWFSNIPDKRSNEVKITERAVRLELSLQHRPDAILNLGGLLGHLEIKKKLKTEFFDYSAFSKNFEKNKSKKNSGLTEKEYQQLVKPSEIYDQIPIFWVRY